MADLFGATVDSVTLSHIIRTKLIEPSFTTQRVIEYGEGATSLQETALRVKTNDGSVVYNNNHNNQEIHIDVIAICDTSTAAFNLNLPATPSDSSKFEVRQASGSPFSTNNLTLTSQGGDTIAGSDSLVINTDNIGLEIIYDSANTNWVVYRVGY